MALAKITYEDKMPLNENATIDAIYKVQHSDMNEIKEVVNNIVDQVGNIDTKTIIDMVYPVGSIYINSSAVDPNTLWPGTTWVRESEGRFILGASSSYTAGSTGGNTTVSISHTHSVPKQDITSGSTTPGATGAASGSTGTPSTANTGSTTPGATGSTTPGATGAATGNTASTTPGNTGSTTPGATGAASGNTGSTTLTTAMIPAHNHKQHRLTWMNDSARYDTRPSGTGGYYMGAELADYYTDNTGGGGGHTHSLNSHTHTSAAHTHTSAAHTHGLNSHTHSSAAHTHTSAAHTHTLNDHTHSLNSHTHTSAAHSHSVAVAASTTGSGGSTSLNIMPSYVVMYVWKRTV